MPKKVTSYIQEVERRGTAHFGAVLYIKIARYDEQPMGWEEIWERFVDAYPDQWAVQMFPPRSHVINEMNIYHLFVLEEPPGKSLTINRG